MLRSVSFREGHQLLTWWSAPRTRWTQSLPWANRLLPLLRFGAWPMPLIDEILLQKNAPCKALGVMAAMAPNRSGRKQNPWIHLPKMKPLQLTWFFTLNCCNFQCRKSSWQDAMECLGLEETSNLSQNRATGLACSSSSSRYIQLHFRSRMALDTHDASTPQTLAP